MKDLNRKGPSQTSKMADDCRMQCQKAEESLQSIRLQEIQQREELNALMVDMKNLAGQMGILQSFPEPLQDPLYEINEAVDKCPALADKYKNCKFPQLSTTEIVISAVAGLVSTAVDVIFVGTPEVVKIYRGGENFKGSILTKILRNYGHGEDPLGQLFHWLSEKCIVPYDISLKSGVVTPNNHRLRGLAHDPFLGLFFAVADIIMGTTTCIDDQGNLTILFNKNPADIQEKLLSVFYYIGHILSDIATARGIPIPGFFMTQFFVDGGSDHSIAKTAEKMYRDGYDMRHFASMSVPLVVKDLIIDSYLYLSDTDISVFSSAGEREWKKLRWDLTKEKMRFIANSISISGNLVKFVAPPNCGNPNALNLPQWYAMVISSIRIVSVATRDRTVETLMEQRELIEQNWKKLLT